MVIPGIFLVLLFAEFSWGIPGRLIEPKVKISACKTPLGETGICVRQEDCTFLPSPITDESGDEQVLVESDFSFCRLNHSTGYVCCPTQELNLPAEPSASHVQQQRLSHPRSPRQVQPESQPASILPNAGECGLPSGMTRLPGFPVMPGYWPWLASLGHRTSSGQYVHTCGGSLISHRHVLTAAHCFHGETKPDLVRLGEHNFDHDNHGERPEEFHIAKKTLHNFTTSNLENDIAILTLDKEVTFNEFIQPVCLPLNDSDSELKYFVVVGWGKTPFGDREGSEDVREEYLSIVDDRHCRSALPRMIPVDNRQLCAGTGSATACIGDSGGPLTYHHRNGRYYLAGILSVELQCQYSVFPGIYTRVSSFLEWIQQNL